MHATSRSLCGSGAFAKQQQFTHLVRRAAHQRRRALVVSNMFTGIVQGTAAVADLDSKENFKAFRIQFPSGKAEGVQIGASVAINGTCLTVTAIDGDVLSFDVMQETLRATSLGNLQVGSKVNFERSARVGDEIGGHNVSGHVHCTAKIIKVEDTENNRYMCGSAVPQHVLQ
eukprot:GHUV01020116.1.p1 GENE.GHUV01020116.1~~GHUV01020116.1.p1  ORF type:complete len:172 (+),score=38.36 GHUV01020116.1:164-679(+)